MAIVKLDEDLAPPVAEPLAERGHEVRSIPGQGWSGITDDVLLARVTAEGAMCHHFPERRRGALGAIRLSDHHCGRGVETVKNAPELRSSAAALRSFTAALRSAGATLRSSGPNAATPRAALRSVSAERATSAVELRSFIAELRSAAVKLHRLSDHHPRYQYRKRRFAEKS